MTSILDALLREVLHLPRREGVVWPCSRNRGCSGVKE